MRPHHISHAKKQRVNNWLRGFLILSSLVLVLIAPQAHDVSNAQDGTGPIAYNTSVFGTIAAPGAVMAYSFNGGTGDLVQADIVPLTDALTLSGTLTGPGGEQLATIDHNRLSEHPRSVHIAQVLPQAGTYTLTVSGDAAGDYALRLLGRTPVPTTTLEFGVPVDVAIPQNATSQYFSFTAGDCPTTLTVTNLDLGDPFTFPFTVKVRNEQGREIALLLGGDALEDRVTVAAQSGRYEVEVLSDDPLMFGTITLLVTCSANAPGCDQAGGTGPGDNCPRCPACFGTFDRGTLPACPVIDFRTLPGMDGGVTLIWNSVPGADHYWIHMYGYRDGDEHYLGAAGAPGDATTFTLDHLFPGFDGFRFVLEALQGEIVICTDETDIVMADRGDICANFSVTGTVTSHTDRTVTWNWTSYPDTESYFVSTVVIMPSGTELLFDDSWYEPETTTLNATYGTELAPANIWRLQVSAMIGGEAICYADATIEFEPEGPGQFNVPECENFAVSILEHVGTHAAISWTEYPGAEAYWLYVLDASGMMVPGYPIFLPPAQLGVAIDVGPGTYTVGVAPWVSPEGAICLQGLSLTFEDDAPCMINTDRRDVRVHVGPGRHRSVFTFLTPGVDYIVTGQATDSEGNLWWQIDKTQISGHEAVISLWVAEADVNEIGNCDQVEEGDVPPIIPDDGNTPSGQWEPCGSCNTCGHPANQCVTSPTGECVWDPTTCGLEDGSDPGGGDDGGGDNGGQTPQCVTVVGTVVPEGTGAAGAITSGNCISEIAGIYTPGSTVQVQAIPNSGCWLDHWAGCGASGSANPVTITLGSSNCVITAYMQCIQ